MDKLLTGDELKDISQRYKSRASRYTDIPVLLSHIAAMTPRAQAAAPPTPDEMLAQRLFEADWPNDKWANHINVGKVLGPDACAKRYLMLAGVAAAALSTTAAQAEAKYREALEPFANHAGLAAFPDASDDRLLMVSVSDLRRAAAILAQTTPPAAPAEES
jgi:hypothetical protein